MDQAGAKKLSPTQIDPRLDRVARLVGETGLARLARAHVIIFGVGGVGSSAAEALARSGVGRITLIDGERVCPTNVNRQLHALESSIGRPKAEAMAERMRLINPALRVEPIAEHYGAHNAERLLPAGADTSFVIDAIDTVTAKLHLLARCVRERIPVVSTMGAAGRLDPTAVRVSDLCESHTDQLAKDVRKYLRRNYGIDCTVPTGILAVWSHEKARLPLSLPGDEDGIPGVVGPAPEHRAPKGQGSAIFVTSVFGMTAASVAVRALLGEPTAGARPKNTVVSPD
ncbi:MAG: tRNA threonylcarbamoyladenosine dehydratase [Myxococcales bacterium]|jgi:tRNA A37 threonylcarbamoyladenosine dehydratase